MNMNNKNKVGQGMVLGMAFGSLVGVLIGKIAICLSLGLAFGVIIGKALSQKEELQDWKRKVDNKYLFLSLVD